MDAGGNIGRGVSRPGWRKDVRVGREYESFSAAIRRSLVPEV